MTTMWSRQIRPPWREGRGIAVRVGTSTALAFGFWGRKQHFEDDPDAAYNRYAIDAEQKGLSKAMRQPESWDEDAVLSSEPTDELV